MQGQFLKERSNHLILELEYCRLSISKILSTLLIHCPIRQVAGKGTGESKRRQNPLPSLLLNNALPSVRDRLLPLTTVSIQENGHRLACSEFG